MPSRLRPFICIAYCRRSARLGKKAGVVLDPASPLDAVEYVLHLCHVIMIMTVNPGFGGQSFLPEMLPKIRRCATCARRADSTLS